MKQQKSRSPQTNMIHFTLISWVPLWCDSYLIPTPRYDKTPIEKSYWSQSRLITCSVNVWNSNWISRKWNLFRQFSSCLSFSWVNFMWISLIAGIIFKVFSIFSNNSTPHFRLLVTKCSTRLRLWRSEFVLGQKTWHGHKSLSYHLGGIAAPDSKFLDSEILRHSVNCTLF